MMADVRTPEDMERLMDRYGDPDASALLHVSER